MRLYKTTWGQPPSAVRAGKARQICLFDIRIDVFPDAILPLMPSLIECVPNFSEGCDASKLSAIAQVMQREGVYLLDRHMDADHNRSVLTLAGEPAAVQESVIRAVGKAAELIDLNQHRGVHPRMGATDVVPFIPLAGVTMEDCAAIARHVGEQIWKRYHIPVYLYEAAASSPERRNLADVRRGQFEALRSESNATASRQPDFGDHRAHPTAGATAVGARKFLIAYNLFLSTPELDIAKQVARAVRFSSGGLPCVKASGFLVQGRAQVSMNLTDFEQTPIWQVYEQVREEAQRRGASIASSELVGLIPRPALAGSPTWFLQTMNFDPLILEDRLARAMAEARVKLSAT